MRADASAPTCAAPARDDAGEVLAARVIELMKCDGHAERPVRRWASTKAQIDALATGAEPQYRVIKNAPVDVGRDELEVDVPRGAALLVAVAHARSVARRVEPFARIGTRRRRGCAITRQFQRLHHAIPSAPDPRGNQPCPIIWLRSSKSLTYRTSAVPVARTTR